MMYAETNYLI